VPYFAPDTRDGCDGILSNRLDFADTTLYGHAFDFLYNRGRRGVAASANSCAVRADTPRTRNKLDWELVDEV